MEPTVNANEVSRISTGTTVKGEIISSNDIRIDGTFEGKVFSKGKVVVGANAQITGDIVCTNVDFSGKIKGNFYVKDTLALKGSAVVDGDLHTRRLQVDLDAKFNGICKMISETEFDKIVGEVAPEFRPPVRPAAPVAPAAPGAPMK